MCVDLKTDSSKSQALFGVSESSVRLSALICPLTPGDMFLQKCQPILIATLGKHSASAMMLHLKLTGNRVIEFGGLIFLVSECNPRSSFLEKVGTKSCCSAITSTSVRDLDKQKNCSRHFSLTSRCKPFEPVSKHAFNLLKLLDWSHISNLCNYEGIIEGSWSYVHPPLYKISEHN